MGPLGDPFPPATPPATTTSTTSPLMLASSLKIPQWRSARSPETTETTQCHHTVWNIRWWSFLFACFWFAFFCCAAIAGWSLRVESLLPAHHLHSDSGRIITPHKRPIVKTWEHRWFPTHRALGWGERKKKCCSEQKQYSLFCFCYAGDSKVQGRLIFPFYFTSIKFHNDSFEDLFKEKYNRLFSCLDSSFIYGHSWTSNQILAT